LSSLPKSEFFSILLEDPSRVLRRRGRRGGRVRVATQAFTTWSFSPFRNASSVAYAMRSMFSPASFEL